jgi:predicted helicase
MLPGGNLALLVTRQTRDQFDVLVTDTLAGHKSMAAYDINSVFPLFLVPEDTTLPFAQAVLPNLSSEFTDAVAGKLGLVPILFGSHRGDPVSHSGPEDVFYYAYAVFHSPTYRERYAEFLKIDFPRLPLTGDRELFAALVEKGQRLAELHLMREEGRIRPRPGFNVGGSNEVEKVRYEGNLGRVYLNAKQYFEGVEPEVWEFHIGGYQVCDKWLKDRKGRTLGFPDISHYQKIVLALRETRQLMQEIDEVIPGWPLQ